jgi:cytochrome c-type biogenesis protein CcmH/NrfG
MSRRTSPVQDAGPARAELLEFLRSAPPSLQAWADGEIATLGEPSTEPPEDAAAATQGIEDPAGEPDDDFEPALDDEEDTGLVPRDGPVREGRPGAGRWVRRWSRSRPVLAVAALAVVAAVVGGVYKAGGTSVPGISGTATNTASADSSTGTKPVDQAQVAALMTKISTNPKDVTSLAALGDLYFAAGDYATAAGWQQKVLQVEPRNVTALLALGASTFNQGDSTTAERQWLQAVALDPRQAEAHYDLGFLYLSENPPNMAKVRQEWNKVVEIDPNSEIAKTVATHLSSLQTASPSASPTSGK